MYTAEQLKNFEIKVCDLFQQKKILAPVHLYDGNEDQMINIFKNIKSNDWVFCTWRSHYQCLLKGVTEDRLLHDIQNGRSIALCYPEHNIFSSAIVTGVIPIACGVAYSNKLKNINSHVYCFVGDMTSQTGCFYENYKYSVYHDLPITWIIEDNNKSVCTDTRKTWNTNILNFEGDNNPKIIYYKYQSKYPHAGTGQRIQF
jgi:pyruvate dehydrogenase E1 component alpha subunit